MASNDPPSPAPPTPAPSPAGSTSRRLEWATLVVQAVLAILTLLTLYYVTQQSASSARQASEAENQTATARLEAVYHMLLQWDQFLSLPENAKLRAHLSNEELRSLNDIGDPQERLQVEAALVQKLNYLDYAYVVLNDLVPCVPEDGHFVLRESSEAGECDNDDWVSWSESFAGDFSDPVLCEVLTQRSASYGKKFRSAINQATTCQVSTF